MNIFNDPSIDYYTHRTTIEIPLGHGCAFVELRYTPGTPARTWGRPDDWHPAEPGTAEIDSVTLTWDEDPDRTEVLDVRASREWAEAYADVIDEHVARLGCEL